MFRNSEGPDQLHAGRYLHKHGSRLSVAVMPCVNKE
jgi:hypothetical protein